MDYSADAVMLDGLRAALMEATGNLYRVFTSEKHPDYDPSKPFHEHEKAFLRGVRKHQVDYETMVKLISGWDTTSPGGIPGL